jgi:hypothetical protein
LNFFCSRLESKAFFAVVFMMMVAVWGPAHGALSSFSEEESLFAKYAILGEEMRLLIEKHQKKPPKNELPTNFGNRLKSANNAGQPHASSLGQGAHEEGKASNPTDNAKTGGAFRSSALDKSEEKELSKTSNVLAGRAGKDLEIKIIANYSRKHSSHKNNPETGAPLEQEACCTGNERPGDQAKDIQVLGGGYSKEELPLEEESVLCKEEIIGEYW